MHHVRDVEFDAVVHKALACESIGNHLVCVGRVWDTKWRSRCGEQQCLGQLRAEALANLRAPWLIGRESLESLLVVITSLGPEWRVSRVVRC